MYDIIDLISVSMHDLVYVGYAQINPINIPTYNPITIISTNFLFVLILYISIVNKSKEKINISIPRKDENMYFNIDVILSSIDKFIISTSLLFFY